MRFRTRKPLLPLLALAAAGCTANRALVLQPVAAPGDGKIPLSVAFAGRTSSAERDPIWLFSDPRDCGGVKIQYLGALAGVTERMLTDAFARVQSIGPREATPAGADFRATLDVDATPNTGAVWLSLSDPATGEVVARYVRKFQFARRDCGSFSSAVLQYLPFMWFLIPVNNSIWADRQVEYYRAEFQTALAGIAEDLRAYRAGLEQIPARRAAFQRDVADADAALKAGDKAKAFSLYLRQLQSLDDAAARFAPLLDDRFLPLVREVDPPPVPEEARKRNVMGQTRFKEAKSRADYVAAAADFQAAVRAAPWWGQLYFNLGLAQEGAQAYGAAITSFNRYLKAVPDARDADDVKKRTYALETKVK